MHHRIHATVHKANCLSSACAWLSVDGVGLEQWLASHLDYPDIERLGLSLMCLVDDEELALAKRRLVPGEDGTSTLVPLLVCCDDMDFDCTVVMVEQVVHGDTIQWRRFGHSATGGLDVGASTRWFAQSKPVTFARAEFRAAFEGLEDLIARSG
jgi:hypothetical protein